MEGTLITSGDAAQKEASETSQKTLHETVWEAVQETVPKTAPEKKQFPSQSAKCEIIFDNFQNYKSYGLERPQLILSDIPYNVGENFNASRPSWYVDGDNSKGESEHAHKAAFNNDYNFNVYEFMHYSGKILKPEKKRRGCGDKGVGNGEDKGAGKDESKFENIPKGNFSKRPQKSAPDAPCLIVFCAFEQLHEIIDAGKKNGFKHVYPIYCIKNFSPQVLKANQKVVNSVEICLVFDRNKLPKFRNFDPVDGKRHMIKNWMEWQRDGKEIPRVHPTQKPIKLLKRLIEIFTDPGDLVADLTCGSGSTLVAAHMCGRRAVGFECDRAIYTRAKQEMIEPMLAREMIDPMLAKEAVEMATV